MYEKVIFSGSHFSHHCHIMGGNLLVEGRFFLLSFLMGIGPVHAHVTRLTCISHAKFKYVFDRYQSGTAIDTLGENVTKKKCAFSCVVTDSCAFVNYKQDGSRCELLSSSNGDEQTLDGWLIMKTNTTDGNNIGRICESQKPCSVGWKCRDICENGVNKYTCEGLANVAKSTIITSSSYFPQLDGIYCVDGRVDTVCSTNAIHPITWLKFDLSKTVNISEIKVFNRRSQLHRIKDSVLAVSNDDINYGMIGVLTADYEQTYKCEEERRYVKIQKDQPEFLNIEEVEIFTNVKTVHKYNL